MAPASQIAVPTELAAVFIVNITAPAQQWAVLKVPVCHSTHFNLCRDWPWI